MKVQASCAALLSAAFYGMSIPLVKLFGQTGASWASALLYVGAGLAVAVVFAILRAAGKKTMLDGAPIGRKQLPQVLLMIALNAMSAIALVSGIGLCSAATVSLLGNLEVVATAVLAWIIFKEPLTKKMLAAIALITVSGVLLSWTGEGLDFTPGALLVVLACVLWGLENNCTRALSACNVMQVSLIKGFGTGAASAVIALALQEPLPGTESVGLLGVGAVSYGFSIVLYIWAQRHIGAARTSNFYSVAPFVGVILSWLLFGFAPTPAFAAALILSLAGVALTSADVKAVSLET